MQLQQHPDYHQGFWDSMEGWPLLADMSAEYTEGWFAFQDCAAILAGVPSTAREEYARG
jgi:hypothetical protein